MTFAEFTVISLQINDSIIVVVCVIVGQLRDRLISKSNSLLNE